MGVHLRHLAAGHPAQAVEVVQQRVPVDPAGHRQPGGRWRRLVGRQRPYGVQPPEPPREHRLPGPGVPRVEAALEAHVKDRSGALDLGDRRQCARQIQGDRLLAEDRKPGACCPTDQFGVGRRGRRDHHGVHAPAEDLVHPWGGRLAQPVRELLGTRVVRVRQDQGSDLAVTAECVRMNGAYAARPDDPDAHETKVRCGPGAVNAYVRTTELHNFPSTGHGATLGPCRNQKWTRPCS